MSAEKTESPEERTKICLQKFADGVMLGHRIRILEAIDKRINEIDMTVEFTSLVESHINGLKEARDIIENLK